MVNILRRWNQPIMVVITVLVIVSFVYWGPNIGNRDRSEQAQAILYGQEIKVAEFQRVAKRVAIYAEMGGNYSRAIFPGAEQFMYQRGHPLDGLNRSAIAELLNYRIAKFHSPLHKPPHTPPLPVLLLRSHIVHSR